MSGNLVTAEESKLVSENEIKDRGNEYELNLHRDSFPERLATSWLHAFLFSCCLASKKTGRNPLGLSVWGSASGATMLDL